MHRRVPEAGDCMTVVVVLLSLRQAAQHPQQQATMQTTMMTAMAIPTPITAQILIKLVKMIGMW
eukprot:m.197028 g.197028  ORF g.197028 m.197028 type:complete len:64 (+) comp39537_c0_seq36:436-627(+)